MTPSSRCSPSERPISTQPTATGGLNVSKANLDNSIPTIEQVARREDDGPGRASSRCRRRRSCCRPLSFHSCAIPSRGEGSVDYEVRMCSCCSLYVCNRAGRENVSEATWTLPNVTSQPRSARSSREPVGWQMEGVSGMALTVVLGCYTRLDGLAIPYRLLLFKSGTRTYKRGISDLTSGTAQSRIGGPGVRASLAKPFCASAYTPGWQRA